MNPLAIVSKFLWGLVLPTFFLFNWAFLLLFKINTSAIYIGQIIRRHRRAASKWPNGVRWMGYHWTQFKGLIIQWVNLVMSSSEHDHHANTTQFHQPQAAPLDDFAHATVCFKTKLIGKKGKKKSGSFTYKWFSNPSKTTKRLQPVQNYLNPTAQNRDQTSRLTQTANKRWIFKSGKSSIAASLDYFIFTTCFYHALPYQEFKDSFWVRLGFHS